MNTIVASEANQTISRADAMSKQIASVVDAMNANTVESFKAAHGELERLQRLVFLSAERVKLLLESHVNVAQVAQDHAESIVEAMRRLREEHKALGET
jgi:hypothetical protein